MQLRMQLRLLRPLLALMRLSLLLLLLMPMLLPRLPLLQLLQAKAQRLLLAKPRRRRRWGHKQLRQHHRRLTLPQAQLTSPLPAAPRLLPMLLCLQRK